MMTKEEAEIRQQMLSGARRQLPDGVKIISETIVNIPDISGFVGSIHISSNGSTPEGYIEEREEGDFKYPFKRSVAINGIQVFWYLTQKERDAR